MNEYDEIIESAIAELTELAHNDLIETDEDYSEKQHELSMQSVIIKTVEQKLTADENERFKEFRGLESELIARHIQASYIRGGKDCVTLLKKLGVI